VHAALSNGLQQVDPDSTVRDAAFQCHDAFHRLLQTNSRLLREEEEKKRQSQAEGQAKLNGIDMTAPTPPADSSVSWAMCNRRMTGVLMMVAVLSGHVLFGGLGGQQAGLQ
jgi:hypothetical protein